MHVNHPAAVPQSLGSGRGLVLRGIELLLNVDTRLNAELSWKYLKFAVRKTQLESSGEEKDVDGDVDGVELLTAFYY